jgi:signal transduction histidine kinase
MKITTRISLGYGLFIAILLSLVVYQVFAIHRIQSINRTVSGIDFQNTLVCLQAMKDLDLVEEHARKSFALADPDYQKLLQDYRKDFGNGLNVLKNRANSKEELIAMGRLLEQWNSFNDHLTTLQQQLPLSRASLPDSLQEDLGGLNAQIRSVYQANLNSMSSKVEKSRKAGETAALVFWFATLVVFIVSILVSFFIYRSISRPLANLTEGTRAIAEGKFFYGLDTTRDDEFSQLARDFNTMTRRLDALDQLKKDFVSHVSHELKSPLASMRETVQLLLDQIPGPLNEKQERFLELNQQCGVRLASMIRNLLDLSRTEAGVMEYELKSRDLIPLVRSAIEELEVQAQERQIQIRPLFPEAPLAVDCDGDRIVQVLINLLGNALKFSPKSSTVEVIVEAISNLPEGIPSSWHSVLSRSDQMEYFGLITVSDSGPGISDADKEKVFEKFHQVKQGKKMPGQGVGLGLAICYSIVLAHRGAVWVEDNPGGGCRFMLLLKGSGQSAVGSGQ